MGKMVHFELSLKDIFTASQMYVEAAKPGLVCTGYPILSLQKRMQRK
jgi:hypothetical protein